jgi:DNA-binding response OmpR family regulator
MSALPDFQAFDAAVNHGADVPQPMPEAPPQPAAMAPAPAPSQGMRVLLVEDDRMAAMMVSSMLSDLGYQVEMAQNGAEAYALLREAPTRADMVLTDRFMPALDGLGLTRRLRREPATQHMPIVMLTGTGDSASIAEGIEAGVQQYLTKPVDPNLLQQVMQATSRQIEQRRAAARTLQSHQAGFSNIQRIDFHLRTMAEIAPVSSLLASLADNPEKVIVGLRELLTNAVEHGIYRLGGQAKAQHLSQGTLDAELARREADPDYTGVAEAAAQRLPDGIKFAFRDPGPGFAWQRFIRPDPAQGIGQCGRGIARSALIFNKVEFHGTGNLVTATLASRAATVW